VARPCVACVDTSASSDQTPTIGPQQRAASRLAAACVQLFPAALILLQLRISFAQFAAHSQVCIVLTTRLTQLCVCASTALFRQQPCETYPSLDQPQYALCQPFFSHAPANTNTNININPACLGLLAPSLSCLVRSPFAYLGLGLRRFLLASCNSSSAHAPRSLSSCSTCAWLADVFVFLLTRSHLLSPCSVRSKRILRVSTATHHWACCARRLPRAHLRCWWYVRAALFLLEQAMCPLPSCC